VEDQHFSEFFSKIHFLYLIINFFVIIHPMQLKTEHSFCDRKDKNVNKGNFETCSLNYKDSKLGHLR
jgi:hypothetical protein